MKRFMFTLACLLPIVLFIGCSPPTTSVVKIIPIIGTDGLIAKSITASKNVAVSQPGTGGLSFTLFGPAAVVPVVTGWTGDTSSVSSTNTFVSQVFGQPVTTTITTNGSDIIYNGLFSDGIGTYTITYHSTSNTFDFSQTVIYDYTPTDGFMNNDVLTMLISMTMNGAQIGTGNNSYSGSGPAYAAIYDKTQGNYLQICAATLKIIAQPGRVAELNSVYFASSTAGAPNPPTYDAQPSAIWNSISVAGTPSNHALMYFQNGVWTDMDGLMAPANYPAIDNAWTTTWGGTL